MSDAGAPKPTASLLARDRPGTVAIVAGTAVTALSVYLFQVISGRSLGATDFAPIGMILSVQFLIFTVLDIPVEQFVTRRLVIGGGRWTDDNIALVTVALPLLLGVVLGTGFVMVTRDRFFGGSAAYAVAMGCLLGTRAVAALGRGALAGRRRFRAYGATLALEGVVAVGLAIVVAATNPTTVTFASVLPLGPLVVLLVRPFRSALAGPDLTGGVVVGPGFLSALVAATAASQILLAAGPVVVGFIGGTAVAISVIFVTFTLFRGPVTSAYPLVARILPDFTAIAALGEERRLNRWVVRLAIGGAGAGLLFGMLGWLLGPTVVEWLYGSGFVPSSGVAALAAAAVGFALASLFLNQVYVARGNTGRLAAVWWGALTIAAIALVTVGGEPMRRVAIAFAVGEGAALGLLVVVALIGHRASRPTSEP